jgi:hypothetical protein
VPRVPSCHVKTRRLGQRFDTTDSGTNPDGWSHRCTHPSGPGHTSRGPAAAASCSESCSSSRSARMHLKIKGERALASRKSRRFRDSGISGIRPAYSSLLHTTHCVTRAPLFTMILAGPLLCPAVIPLSWRGPAIIARPHYDLGQVSRAQEGAQGTPPCSLLGHFPPSLAPPPSHAAVQSLFIRFLSLPPLSPSPSSHSSLIYIYIYIYNAYFGIMGQFVGRGE